MKQQINQYNKDGERHGYWKDVHEDESISTSNYHNGLLHGEIIRVNNKGVTLFIAYYYMGKPIDTWKAFYSNGNPKYIQTFNNNNNKNTSLIGIAKDFSKDGTLFCVKYYII